MNEISEAIIELEEQKVLKLVREKLATGKAIELCKSRLII